MRAVKIAADKTGYLAGDRHNNYPRNLKQYENKDRIRAEGVEDADSFFLIGKIGVLNYNGRKIDPCSDDNQQQNGSEDDYFHEIRFSLQSFQNPASSLRQEYLACQSPAATF